MKIEVTKNDNYTEIQLTGRLDSNSSTMLEKVIIDTINSGSENLLINFNDLVYINSSGLRVFLVAAKMLKTKGKKLNFFGMRDFITEVFNIAGFTSMFNIGKSRVEVISISENK